MYVQNLVQLKWVIITPDILSTEERGLELNYVLLEAKHTFLINEVCETKIGVQSHKNQIISPTCWQ